MNNQGAICLFKEIIPNTKLEVIDLRNNSIAEEGVLTLDSIMRSNTTLIEVNLRNNSYYLGFKPGAIEDDRIDFDLEVFPRRDPKPIAERGALFADLQLEEQSEEFQDQACCDSISQEQIGITLISNEEYSKTGELMGQTSYNPDVV